PLRGLQPHCGTSAPPQQARTSRPGRLHRFRLVTRPRLTRPSVAATVQVSRSDEGDTMTARLLLPLLALILPTTATAAIRPSFHLDTCSWRATHVVVVSEGETIDGAVTVLESWVGDLRPGDTLAVPELAAFAPEKARAIAP